ncbi:hypothetical protein HanIR_Chr04g0204191 [Helianthus annuus]|nr:hypothetical protein HanIR_Chr04g0204191 [Helianthus annuus]
MSAVLVFVILALVVCFIAVVCCTSNKAESDQANGNANKKDGNRKEHEIDISGLGDLGGGGGHGDGGGHGGGCGGGCGGGGGGD